MTSAERANRVIVGVDGSEAASAALAFAAEEAKLRGAELRILHVWGIPKAAYSGYVSQLDDYERDAQVLLEGVVKEAKESYPELNIDSKLGEGSPANFIIEESKDAKLVVVGSRGHGGFTGLLLGSVSQQLVHHASTPVVIVHPERHKDK
ncbi:MAG: universal stress protein [Actinomycetota bacterium]|nr:universal stress protein [Actinomycetota bacterium]